MYYVDKNVRGIQMIDFNKTKKCRRYLIRIVILMLVCVFWLPFTGLKAEAATTCKSSISYPGKISSKVNFRKKAGTKYTSYGLVEKGEKLTILGSVTNQGMTWYKCKTKVKGKTKTGYISSSYVIKASKPKGKVNSKVKTYLNLRKSTSSSSKALLKLKPNTKVTIYTFKKVSGKYWFKIKAKVNKKTKTGYVDAKYITIDTKKESSAATEKPQEGKTQSGYVNDKVTTSLNVREEPSTTSKVLLSIPRKTKVTIHGTTDDWYQITVTYNGKTVTGYVAKEYITIEEDGKEEPPEETPEQKPKSSCYR